MPVPCREWMDKLAAAHSDDLSPSERDALNQHVATCDVCATVRDEYRSMDALILELPVVAPLPVSLIASERLEEDGGERNEPLSIATGRRPTQRRKRLSRAGKMLSTVAAVLVVGVIVGCFALLFSLSRNDTESGSSFANPSSGTMYVATDTAKSEAYAMNPVNGAILWKHLLGYKLTGPGIVVHGLLVFASYNGSIYAYHTSNGSLAWQMHVDNSGSAAPSLTPVSSASDVVYFSTMGGNVGALRTSNGSLVWKKHLSTCTQYCDDYGAQVDDGMYYAFANGLYALNASNGNAIWQNLDLKVSTSFAVASGKIFVLPSESIAWPRKNPSNILVLNASDGQQIKSLPGINFTAGDGVLYIENFDSTWYAMRISDGSILWRSTTKGCSLYTYRLSENIQNGDAIFSAMNVTEAGSTNISGPNVTPTTVISQSGYSEICAMSTEDGHILWDWKTASLDMVTTPIEFNGVAYFDLNTHFEARRASDGKVLWQVAFPATLQGPTIG